MHVSKGKVKRIESEQIVHSELSMIPCEWSRDPMVADHSHSGHVRISAMTTRVAARDTRCAFHAA